MMPYEISSSYSDYLSIVKTVSVLFLHLWIFLATRLEKSTSILFWFPHILWRYVIIKSVKTSTEALVKLTIEKLNLSAMS